MDAYSSQEEELVVMIPLFPGQVQSVDKLVPHQHDFDKLAHFKIEWSGLYLVHILSIDHKI
jgi:hypothetical protein